jgi:hypothetical protein
MKTVLRRVLVFATLGLWMGGFTFYSAVVVPVGQEVLGSHRKQGFVTRRVTNYLNLAGVVAMISLGWDIAASRTKFRRRRVRWALWAIMGFTLAMLAWLHRELDDLLVADSFAISDESAFSSLHRWYLMTSTIQWACAMTWTVLTLFAWREEACAVVRIQESGVRNQGSGIRSQGSE